MHEVIIIGAGPAGITASVYAARKKMELLVITEDIGGQTVWSGDVGNYTGYQFVTGPDLAAKFEEHMRLYKIPVRESERAVGVIKKGETVLVKTDRSEYESKAVIVASGKKSKELGVPGEKEFKNRGLTYCATCDGPLFAGKDVAVIGGGNSALDAAAQLIKIASRVYIIDVAARFTGDRVLEEKVLASSIVTVFHNTRVTGIIGDTLVTGIRVAEGREERTLSIQGVFVEIGLIPNSGFAEGLATNERGEIKVDTYNRTSVEGIFAAGDVTDVPGKQIIIAAGEGAKAALSAFAYVTRHR